MLELERRWFLRGVATAGAATLGTTVSAAPTAWGAVEGRETTLHEQLVRDAHMVWTGVPSEWQDAPFLGNRVTTVQVVGAERGEGLVFALGRAGDGWGVPTGRLKLAFAGAITGMRCVLDLWNAELTGTVTTTRGTMSFSALVHQERDTLLLSMAPGGGEQAAALTELEPQRDDHVVRWREKSEGTRRVVAAGLGADNPADVLAADTGSLLAAHRAWWNRFYTSSLVSVPDKSLQRFHWIQLYTAGSAVPGDPALGSRAPALLNGSNHPDIHPATAAAEHGGWGQSADHRVFGIPGAGLKAGGAPNPVLAWNLPGVFDCYRHTMDERILRDVLHPMLRKAAGFYAEFLTEDSSGTLHLPPTYSPDYADVADCTHDLSLLRWSASLLAGTGPRFGLDEHVTAKWLDIAERLVPYHTDDTGAMIGAGVRLARSVRNPAHLLWLHPLGEPAHDRYVDTGLMRLSFDHWASMPEAWQGSSYVAAASMAAALRSPEEALRNLEHVLSGAVSAGTQLMSSTLYRNGDASEPDVSYRIGQALFDMVLDGRNGVLDVFPAVPRSWPDVSIAGLRAPGAFVVDAGRRDGRTEWVRVRSGTGRPVVLRHGIPGPVDVYRQDGHDRVDRGRESAPTVALQPGPGESVVVVPRGTTPDLEPRDVPAQGTPRRWGWG